MSFGVGELELALLDLAVDALTACDRPVPIDAEVYRYHGQPTHWMGCEPGRLYTYWRRAFPNRTGMPIDMNNPPGRQQLDVFLRLIRCWPQMTADGSTPVGLDAAAAGLALDLDCLWSALYRAICDGTLGAYLSGCDQLQLVDATPREGRGGWAGIEFHLVAGWRSWAPDPEEET